MLCYVIFAEYLHIKQNQQLKLETSLTFFKYLKCKKKSIGLRYTSHFIDLILYI